MTDQLRQTFLEEVPDHLAELESALLELHTHPGDADQVQRVFRAMHTIKGLAAMFGFDTASRFAHELETAFDNVREGRMVVSSVLVDLTLEARDEIHAMLLGSTDGASEDPARQATIVERLRALCSASMAAATPEKPTPGADLRRRWRIRFRPARDALAQGSDPLLVLRDLRELGELAVTADLSALPDLEQYSPESCYLGFELILATDADRNAIHDRFIFIENSCELAIDPVVDPAPAPTPDANDAADAPAPIPIPIPTPTPTRTSAPAAPAPAPAANPAGVAARSSDVAAPRGEQHEQATAKPTVRVAADKLDSLVNVVGELVVVQARLSNLAGRGDSAELTAIAEEVERLTSGLRDNAMNIRMVPLRATFDRFRRLVHDLTRDLGKEIEFRTEGAETELDKTVIDQLGDPLLHMIRNSADHGIEAPDQRVAAGKPRAGTICLSAVHSGANVLIRVADDGRGLDRDAVRARAIAKGLIAADATLGESETLGLIMSPGFSTAERVTGVSGRGVGMDVVRRSVDALRGTIEVASAPNHGTEVTLRLPLTLAIIEGLLVRVATTHFVVPLSAVVECIELPAAQRDASHNHLVNVRSELIPYIPLRDHFAIDGRRPAIEQIMIVETRAGRCGFVVDEVLGNHQTVIKTLGRVYRGVQVISGATILGDGSVALILDPHRLIQASATLAPRPGLASSRRENA